jgi:hypothetical protein
MSDVDVLEERIRRLRGPDHVGDWLDVRRRARRSRRRTLAIAAAAALLISLPTVAFGGRLLGVLAITGSEERVPIGSGSRVAPYIHADRIYGVAGTPLRLAEPLLAPLLGQEEPLAVPSPGWRYVVYHAWDGEVRGGGTPVLRTVDVRTGSDTELARGAQSVAIHREGRVAFTRASRARYEPSADGTLGGRFGHVVVASSLDAPAERWTAREGEYVVLAWARETLLVEARPGPGYLLPAAEAGPPPGIYAIEGPGVVRALPIRGLVAVSPDGSRVLGWWSEGDGPSIGSRLVEVASGRIIAESPLKLTRRGAWHRERVVVSVGPNAHSVAVLGVQGDSIAVERRLPLAVDRVLRARYGPFLGSPVFRNDGRTVIMRVASVTKDERAKFVGFLTCDVTARACVRGRNLQPPTTWGAIVHNPSRPAPVAESPSSKGAHRR